MKIPLALVALVAFAALAPKLHAEPGARWEYKVEKFEQEQDAEYLKLLEMTRTAKVEADAIAASKKLATLMLARIEKKLNDLGAVGWELISIEKGEMVLKRQKPVVAGQRGRER